jgi:DNA polymerase I
VDSASNRYNLDDLAKKYLNYTTVKYEEVVSQGQLFSDIDLDTAVRYGAEDSDITLRLYQTLLPKLEKLGLDKILFDLEMPLVEILCNMELEGVLLQPSRLESFRTDLEAEISEVQNSIFTLCGKSFNLNSPKQLQEILFVDRNLPTGRKTHSGFSTDSDVLEELSSNTDDPVPPLILRYRMLNKLLSTYVLTLPTLINEKTGRVHTSFFQTGTATGRLSSKNPNLQNIPIRTEEGRKIRDAFVPKKGCVFMSADYSQIELVVLAHISGDKNLREAFIAGEDIHKDTAAKIFKIFPEMVSSQQRRVAKTINFGIMYGMSAFRLSKDLKISRSDAKKFIDVYFEEYSGVRTFIEKVKTQAKQDGYVRTAMGHIRYIPEMQSSNKTVLAGAERIAVNTIIQGTAAEIMKLAMISTSKAIEKKGLKSKILLQVHDEMIFEVPEDEVEQMSTLVRSCMEKAYKLSIPLKVGLETGSSWGEMH